MDGGSVQEIVLGNTQALFAATPKKKGKKINPSLYFSQSLKKPEIDF